MKKKFTANMTRRGLLRSGFYGLGAVGAAGMPWLSGLTHALDAAGNDNERILVVVELSGGNDGLNTVVPFQNDHYYRLRPTLAIPKNEALTISDDIGFHPSLRAFEALYKDGKMAVIHGCGYDNPSLSHFTSMSYWHTGVPNGGEPLGWAGRFMDARWPEAERENLLLNIADSQSLAVRSRLHTPLVFDNPAQLNREGDELQKQAYSQLVQNRETGNGSLQFLQNVAENAASSSEFVRDAAAAYRTPVDYGISGLGGDLRNVAALIDAGIGSKVYYTSYRGNAFDTHVYQADLHSRLLLYAADAINGFMRDIERLGRGREVAVMVFTEFGRRVEENASQGTDHGTATPMFVFSGSGEINGGLYGTHPSLGDLDDGNLRMTTDFRRVYASMIQEWMQYPDSAKVLRSPHAPLTLFRV
ncbi:MAG: DUF1501 domain-containing protein [Pseudohongiellaceae bacterium]